MGAKKAQKFMLNLVLPFLSYKHFSNPKILLFFTEKQCLLKFAVQ
jgi:hypothetical protein